MSGRWLGTSTDQPSGCVLDPEIQLFKDAIDDGVFDRRTEEGFDAFGPKRGGDWLPFARINVDDIAIDRTAGKRLDHRRGAIAGVARHFDVGAPFETIRCFAQQAERT